MSLRICAICYLVTSLLACHSHRGQFYHVKRGETITRIAHQHDISVGDIQKANPQLNINLIYEHQRLWIPSTKKASVANAQVQSVIAKASPPKPTRSPTPVTKSKTKTKAKPSPQTKKKLNFHWPYKGGRVLNGFGKQNLKMHNGIDIEIPQNHAIKSSQSGKVAYVGEGIDGYGKTLILQHPDYLFTIYSYVGSVKVKKGQSVSQDQIIATSRAEKTSKTFFHFEIRKVKTALDPLQLLPLS